MLIELDRGEKFKNSKYTTLAVFKVFNGKTPNTLTRKLFRRNNNLLSFKGLSTKVVQGDNEEGIINTQECLIYYYFTGITAPKIELPNTLYVYRKCLDKDFDKIEYFNTYNVDQCRKIRRLNNYWSCYMVNVLIKFINKES